MLVIHVILKNKGINTEKKKALDHYMTIGTIGTIDTVDTIGKTQFINIFEHLKRRLSNI
jgi:hypothetical protein